MSSLDPMLTYEVFEFDSNEKELLTNLISYALNEITPTDLQQLFLSDKKQGSIIHVFDIEVLSKLNNCFITNSPESLEYTERLLKNFVEKAGIHVSNEQRFIESLTQLLVGYGSLKILVDDPDLEEIMVNGIKKPIYVFHHEHGMCRTNVEFSSDKELSFFVNRVAKQNNLVGNKIIDAHLPDGSRLNATLPPVSKHPSVTIRKFSSSPFSLADLIKSKVISVDLAAFLWLCVDGINVSPQNILIVGGVGSGKTTLLNALSEIIPIQSRLIVIEDTPELNLGSKENLVQLETSLDHDLQSLVKNSMRMRPDRIILGEVRGKEATDLFTAMDIGCSGSMGTIHANNSKELLVRLQNNPMNVPDSLISIVDLVVVLQKFNWGGKIIRRAIDVSELSLMENNVSLSKVFDWNRGSDNIFRNSTPSQTIEKLAFSCGVNKEEIQKELLSRTEFLRDSVKQNLSSRAFTDAVQSYYVEKGYFQ